MLIILDLAVYYYNRSSEKRKSTWHSWFKESDRCITFYKFVNTRTKQLIGKFNYLFQWNFLTIGHGDKNLLNELVFTELAGKYGKNNVQIILRWQLQEGNIVFPKSTNLAHLRDNINIFDFELTEDEMTKIRALDKGVRFFNMSLSEQEAHLSQFVPED